jgi:hypothetical protein
MQDAAFETYMQNRSLADKTRMQRTYALKRIERVQNLDLDAEFDRDQLADLIQSYSYSASDARAGLPNPSRMDIDGDKLLTHLRWYRSHLMDYLRFRGGTTRDGDDSAGPESELIEEVVSRTFALERDLQAALRTNLDQLEEGLTVEDGGKEKQVEAGFIDILARDWSGVLTIIELKVEVAQLVPSRRFWLTWVVSPQSRAPQYEVSLSQAIIIPESNLQRALYQTWT